MATLGDIRPSHPDHDVDVDDNEGKEEGESWFAGGERRQVADDLFSLNTSGLTFA